MIFRKSSLVRVLFLLAASLFSGAFSVRAARSDSGLPFYSVYNLDFLGKGAVSVRFSEDASGRLIAIDNGALLVFDGTSWTSRLDSEQSSSDTLTCAAMGPDGRFYAGSVGRWGWLELTPGGDFAFRAFVPVSLPEWISTAHFEQVLPTPRGVFYSSTQGVVCQEYSSAPTHYWDDNRPAEYLFNEGDRVFMSVGSGGIYELGDNWIWTRVPGTEPFYGSDAIVRAAHLKPGLFILASQSGKLFKFDGKQVTRWTTDVDSMLTAGIVDMIALASGDTAVAIRGYGVVVIGPSGSVKMRLGIDHDDTFSGVRSLYQMEDGVLLVSLPGSVAKVYYPSQVSFYDYRYGIPMSWPEIYHFKDSLVVFSDYRLYRANYDMSGNLYKFDDLDIAHGQLVESCLGIDGDLLYGVSGSLYCYDGENPPEVIVPHIASGRIRAVKGQPDYVVVFGSDRHLLLHRQDGKWSVVQSIPSSGFPAVVLQTCSGDMWIEHGLGRVCRIRVENGRMSSTVFENIEDLAEIWVNIWELNGQIYLSSGSTIKRFDSAGNKIVDAPEMRDLLNLIGGKVSRIYEADDGTLWASGSEGVFLVRTVDGRTVVDRNTLRPVSESHPLIQFDDDGVVWIMSRSRIIRYDPSLAGPHYRPLKPVISLATATSANSSRNLNVELSESEDRPVILSSERNSLVIRLFPNTYSLPSPPHYRYRIAGLKNEWTSPAGEPLINLSNMWEGSYRLDVEVLDQNIPVGAVSSYYFRILPPWYRTWWAYMIYVVCFFSVVILIVRISQRHSERERHRLERIVTMRTRELDDTNTRLRESIKSAMAAAEAKSRFLANMSHEIRTPMNGVVGTTELLSRTPLTSEQRELVDIINKSGSLLLSIVNDVLDYSKIEADQIVFELIPLRPQNLLEDVLEILGEKVNERKVEFFGSIDESMPFELIGDTTRVQQILVNLASNALKFTDNGEVEIRGWAVPRQDGRFDVHFSVRDTGIGMDPRRMNRLFKAFTQLDASNTRVYGGTGLGLAISKRLVERMGGLVDVTSEVGKGSRFEISIPLPVSDRPATPEEPVWDPPKTLLLVDSCEARRNSVGAYLSTKGYDVHVVNSGEAVQKIGQGERFEAVVVDCDPEDRGWKAVADAVSARMSRVPLIAYRLPLQTVDHPAVVRRLTKPWRCTRLLAELRNCLNAHMEKLDDSSLVQGEVEQAEFASSLRVLLAEDNAVNQRVAVLLLGRIGIKPDLANNGEEAVDLVKSNHYDIVLMDVQMPVMDGIQATLAIRGDIAPERQPIIVALTAGAMSSDREAAFSSGVDAYLTKPLRLETLREQINDLSERVRMRRASNRSRSKVP